MANLSVSVFDSVGVTDAVNTARLVTFGRRSVSESVAVTESVTALRRPGRVAAESLTVTDVATPLIKIVRITALVSDAVSVTDATYLSRRPREEITVTDAVLAELKTVRLHTSVFDTLTVTDRATAFNGILTRPFFTLEMELSGRGNGWTDVTDDVIVGGSSPGLSVEYGIRGSTPNDLVASSGEARFVLNNAATNSARRRGYYSPGHSLARTGFGLGIRVRIRFFRQSGFTRYKHVGRLVLIQPRGGVMNHSITVCQTVDWMDEAARTKLPPETPLQINKRSDEIFSVIVNQVASAPDAVEAQIGQDTYPYALDTQRASLTAMGAFQDLADSERSRVFVMGDEAQGGTLVYESRRARALAGTSIFTLSAPSAMNAYRSTDETYTKVQAIAHPRRVDTSNVVLFRLQSVPSIPSGVTYFLLASYRDPTQESARMGATDVLDPVATTDYLFNTAADGSGSDITASLIITAEKGAAGVRFSIYNTNAATGYLTFLQIRGKGIYDFENAIAEAEDATAISQLGERLFVADLKYQPDFPTANEIALYILQIWKSPLTLVAQVTFHASASPQLLDQAIRREISDRITLRESVTAIDRDYFINAIRLNLSAGGRLDCTWTLEPADATRYWFLEVSGSTELDLTTRLGFGLVVGHTDIAHIDVHGDVAHGDVAHSDISHSDTHSDTAHGDTAHADSHTDSHTDVAHGDSAHTDVAHGDVAHGDSHSDVAHSDTAHSDTAHADTHSDVAHADIAHSDTAHNDSHSDVAHSDSAHDDSHGDVAFSDVAHSDTHGDTAHSDTHNDTHTDHTDVGHADVHVDSHFDSAHDDEHGDVAHSDTAHTDNHGDSHGDTSHSDTHGDTAHGDVAHSDTAHGDTHSDTLHSDVAHADVAHTDITGSSAHVDTPHEDAGHTDGAHQDTHGDVAHADITHSDSAHADTHADVAHGDVLHSDTAHTDTHSDTAHGDIG